MKNNRVLDFSYLKNKYFKGTLPDERLLYFCVTNILYDDNNDNYYIVCQCYEEPKEYDDYLEYLNFFTYFEGVSKKVFCVSSNEFKNFKAKQITSSMFFEMLKRYRTNFRCCLKE